MTPFVLEEFYASEAAKRRFGRICQAVHQESATVHLLGTVSSPQLILAGADEHPPEPADIEITIDEAKADWPAITTAALVYGTRFRIRGKRHVRAVLYRHPSARHPAERYIRSQTADADLLAQKLEGLAREVRKLGGKMLRALTDRPAALGDVIERLAVIADLIDRRFMEAWRVSNGHSIPHPTRGERYSVSATSAVT
jgi:hypothetical protein